MWARDPHLAASTGLARYFDFGEGPTPESLQDEGGSYRKVISYFIAHPEQADHYLVEQPKEKTASAPGASYAITICEVATTGVKPECEPERLIRLSADY